MSGRGKDRPLAARTARERAEREQRRRAREYTARQSVHEQQVRRRRRDTIVGAVAVVAVAAIATAAQVGYFTAGPGKPKASASASASPTPSATATVPAKSLSENRTWTGSMTLNSTKLGISLDGKKAPQAVANFVTLANKGFYTGLTCHRLTTKPSGLYILQCGDPTGTGDGGPGYTFGPLENVPDDNVYKTGVIAMARGESATSQGSQFFIVYQTSDIPSTTGGYTVFGRVTSGMDALRTAITDHGLANSADAKQGGAPKVATKITALSVK